MNSPAHDIALYLASIGHGVFGSKIGWAIFVGAEPDTPDDAITIYDTGGDEPDTDEMDVFRPTIMVRVRSMSYPAAYSKQDDIRKTLTLTTPIIAPTSRFAGIMMQSDVISVGPDDNERSVLTANYRCIRREL